MKYISFFLLTSVVGGLSGYFGAGLRPVPGQIAIVDIKSLLKDSPTTEQEIIRMTDRIREVTHKLVLDGIVILDSDAVLNAPEEAYVVIKP